MFSKNVMHAIAKFLKLTAILALAAITSSHSAVCSDFAVSVGKRAPRLEVGKWLKGMPLTGFDAGHVYIIESWATWCGPCLRSIPHLAALQKKYDDKLSVIGVDVWEEDSSLAEPFVAKHDEEMDYNVAQDLVPVGKTFFDGKFAKEWIEGAGKYSVGIPLAFIVNGQGIIAWIGHPTELDEPLDQIIAGTWDLQAATAKYDKEMREASKSEPYKVAYYDCSRKGDNNGATSACESLLRLDADIFYDWAGREYSVIYADAKQAQEAREFAKMAIEVRYRWNPRLLASLARTIARLCETKDSTELGLAEEAANRACELTGGKKAFAAGAMARVLFAKGEKTKAIDLQKKAVELSEGTDDKEDMQSLLDFMLQHD